ncbi:MAG: glycosyltransferase [Coriobacteriia bacterium]|nr:glycosyltransferase [Coriobacteriia bacterium]
MRIGMFVDMYKPYLSGVTNYVSLYKRRFEELGHEVYVFAFGERDYDDGEPNVIRSAGVPFGATGWQAGVAFSAEAKRLIPTLDIAHVHHPFLSGRLLLQESGRLRIPVVFTGHSRYDLYSDTYASYIPRRIRYWYLRRYLDRFCRACDLVIVPSPTIQRWYREFGVTAPSTLLSNAVDTVPFRRPPRPKGKAELGFQEDTIVLVYLGRVSAEKNVGVLIDAFSRAARSSDGLRLLLVGDGAAAQEASSALAAVGLSGRAFFAGRVPYEQVPDFCAAGDVFVSASVSEVHPLVVMEAMAAGMPAIGVESPGVVDVVDDGETGLLVPAGSADLAGSLAERMTLLARDADMRERLAARAVEVATERYDIRRTAEEMLGHYERLIGRPARPAPAGKARREP